MTFAKLILPVRILFRNTFQPRSVIFVSCVSRVQILEHERQIKDQEGDNANRFHVKDVDGPGRQQIKNTGRVRFGVDHQIIAADG